jgi:hypothetical protein
LNGTIIYDEIPKMLKDIEAAIQTCNVALADGGGSSVEAQLIFRSARIELNRRRHELEMMSITRGM